ncbi:GroES-like protein [Rhizodiscina lignyota]|uniref:GroES-like protein n=1 Tax=Rhizodiscina lignyota TaxID=1504668 RepID=A0A9P4IMS1_9PEZI|nr:GroES-like protein [Rhizodiscina lignyota]
MKALLLDATQRTGVVKSLPCPVPAPNELLIQVKAIALNPVDALYAAEPLGKTGRVLGSDFSGIVVSLGSSVPESSHLVAGSRVAGFLQGASSIDDHPGAFAEFLVCPWDLVWRIGDLPFELAATVSLCALTAAQALFLRFRLPAPFTWCNSDVPDTKDEPRTQDHGPISIFINGASTSVALFASQLAQHTPCPVRLFGSASRKHFSMLSSAPYNYAHLVDYRSPGWPQQVLALTENRGINLAYDCISEGDTVLKTSMTLKKMVGVHGDRTAKLAVVRSREGGAWSTPMKELGVEPSYGAVWEGLGEEVIYAGMTLAPNAVSRAFTAAFYAWLSEGKELVPNPVRIMPGGLANVAEDGFVLLGSGGMNDRQAPAKDQEYMRPVSGEKLVYIIQ